MLLDLVLPKVDGIELMRRVPELMRVLSQRGAGREVRHAAAAGLGRVWTKREHIAVGVLRIFVRNLRLKLGDSADSPTYIFNQPRRRRPHGGT